MTSIVVYILDSQWIFIPLLNKWTSEHIYFIAELHKAVLYLQVIIVGNVDIFCIHTKYYTLCLGLEHFCVTQLHHAQLLPQSKWDYNL